MNIKLKACPSLEVLTHLYQVPLNVFKALKLPKRLTMNSVRIVSIVTYAAAIAFNVIRRTEYVADR